MLSIVLCAAAAALPPDTLAARTLIPGPALRAALAPISFSLHADSAQGQRPRAFAYSRAYETRLAIHHWASYATIPLFAAEYVLGQKLIGDTTGEAPARGPHQAVALGIAGLFGVNTVTGVWNLWEARKDPNARLRRYLHAALMIVSDAGFVATGASAPGGRARRQSNILDLQRTHRAIAVASMSTALASYVMMLLWK
jgi:hypothetical protein